MVRRQIPVRIPEYENLADGTKLGQKSGNPSENFFTEFFREIFVSTRNSLRKILAEFPLNPVGGISMQPPIRLRRELSGGAGR